MASYCKFQETILQGRLEPPSLEGTDRAINVQEFGPCIETLSKQLVLTLTIVQARKPF
jgi:hypothetical protein